MPPPRLRKRLPPKLRPRPEERRPALNAPANSRDRVLVGEITRARGIRGEVVIRSFTEDPRMVAGYGPVADESGRVYALVIDGTDGEMVRARIEGVETRTQAEALRGVRLYVARAALPEPPPGEHYRADLLGLAAVAPDGTRLGRIRAVEDFGGGPFLELDAENADGPICIPFTPETCAVDLAAGVVKVTVPEGLLDPAPKRESEDAEDSQDDATAHPRRRRGPMRLRRRRP
jgi:16S rRNA processing protein RimM